MKIFAHALAATALLATASAPAFAADQAPRARTGADQNRRICLKLEHTGSRMIRTVCRTAAEWERSGGLFERD